MPFSKLGYLPSLSSSQQPSCSVTMKLDGLPPRQPRMTPPHDCPSRSLRAFEFPHSALSLLSTAFNLTRTLNNNTRDRAQEQEEEGRTSNTRDRGMAMTTAASPRHRPTLDETPSRWLSGPASHVYWEQLRKCFFSLPLPLPSNQQ